MRTSFRVLGLLLSLLTSGTALADRTLEETCLAVMAAQKGRPPLGWGEWLRLLAWPASVVRPRQSNAAAPLTAASGTTRIFTVGIPAELSAAEESRLESFDSDLRVLRLHFSRMSRLDRVEECVDLSLREGYDGPRLRALTDESHALQVLFKRREARQFFEEASRSASVYAYSEVTAIQDLGEVLNRSQPFEDVVLVAHADERGRLYDGHRRAIPQEWFKELARTARTVAIYACHPELIRRYYGLDTLSIPVYLPQLQGPLATLDQVPLGLFGIFAKRHSSQLRIRR